MLRRLLSTALLATLPGTALADEPPRYTLDTSHSTKEVKVGETGTVSVVITPAAGLKVHDQAPLTASLKPAKGLTLAKTKLTREDVANKGEANPELKAEFGAAAPGPQSVMADLQFFVCAEKWCERQQQAVNIKINVVPAPVTPPPAQ